MTQNVMKLLVSIIFSTLISSSEAGKVQLYNYSDINDQSSRIIIVYQEDGNDIHYHLFTPAPNNSRISEANYPKLVQLFHLNERLLIKCEHMSGDEWSTKNDCAIVIEGNNVDGYVCGYHEVPKIEDDNEMNIVPRVNPDLANAHWFGGHQDQYSPDIRME